jgi:hypothetical protein
VSGDRRRSAGLGLVLAALGSLLATGPASAGSYDVHACGGLAGAAQHAFAAAADPQMEAYSICPPQQGAGTGIATKASSRGGIAGYTAGAYQIFTAPTGASLESVSFNVGAIRLDNLWSVGIESFDGDFNVTEQPYGCYAGRPGCGVGTSTFSIRVAVPLGGHSRFRFETRCFNPVGCNVSASPFNPANRALFSAANVVVRVQDYEKPWIGPHHGALWNDGWHRGYEEAWERLVDNVGVMITRLYADGIVRNGLDFRDASVPEWARCDFTFPKPCKDFEPGGLSMDTSVLSDGEHSIRVEAIDAAGNLAAIDRQILVDNTPPAKASNTRVEGGEEWRSTNDFTVRWANPPGQTAPIARAHYELCGEGGAACASGAVPGDAIDGLSRLTVPSPGQYTLRVWLEDAAGNLDPDRKSDAIRLRFDDEAPGVVFEHPDVTQPRRVAATVADRGSGIAAAGIEIRPEGGRRWQELDAALVGESLIAQVDDLALPDGIYELRAHARDRAGNERTGDRRRDGTPMRLRLPLRLGADVLLSTRGTPRCPRHARKRKQRCRPRPPAGATIVVKGRTAHVDGLLRTALGAPITGVRVSVSEQLRTGGAWKPVARLESNERGRFSLPVPAGPSRSIRFLYEGTPLVKPAKGELKMLAPAATSIAVDRRNVRNGEAVLFKGSLVGAHVPGGGKLIDLQAYYRGGWRTFATPRTDSRGRWAYRYRFGATRGVVRYRFRARIRREAAYPYELGYSRRVGVTVRG